MSEMARQMAQRLLTALDHVEQLYSTNPLATGDVPETLATPPSKQPETKH